MSVPNRLPTSDVWDWLQSQHNHKCQRGEKRCYSPSACSSFGYCRERNINGMPDDETAAHWRDVDNL